MDNTETLIQILRLAREIGNTTIGKEAVVAIAENYGVVASTRYKDISEIRLYTPLHSGNRITAIKELRERAMENGLAYGLKEAKEEVDRRIFAAQHQATDSW